MYHQQLHDKYNSYDIISNQSKDILKPLNLNASFGHKHPKTVNFYDTSIKSPKIKSLPPIKRNPCTSTCACKSRDISRYRSYSHSISNNKINNGVIHVGHGNGRSGIINHGNTCYQNSIIQLLNAIPELVSFLHHHKDSFESFHISSSLSRAVCSIWERDQTIEINELRSKLHRIKPIWTMNTQEDAHEFLIFLIEILQKECSRNEMKPSYVELEDRENLHIQAEEAWHYMKQWNNSVIDDLFGYQIHSQLTCLKCNTISNKFEYHTTLELELPLATSSSSSSSSLTTIKSSFSSININELIDNYTKIEKLNVEDSWFCPTCAAHTPSTKQMKFYRLPRILLLTLKRFCVHRTSFGYRFSRSNIKINLPLSNIQIQQTFKSKANNNEEPILYKLIGIVDHHGTSNFGHYTTRRCNLKTGKWDLFNDELVRQIDCSEFGESSSAYILAFHRQKS